MTLSDQPSVALSSLAHQSSDVFQFIEHGKGASLLDDLCSLVEPATRPRRQLSRNKSRVCPSSKIVHMDDVVKTAFTNAFKERVKDSSYACGRVIRTGHIEWFAILAERECFRR